MFGATRSSGNHPHRAGDPAPTRFRFLCADDRLDVLALMAETQLLITKPRRRRGFQRPDEIRGRLDFACIRIEGEFHADALVPLETCRFPVALPQRHARRPTHRRDCAAIGVSVHGYLHRHPHFTEDAFGIERQRDEANRAIPDDRRLESLRNHTVHLHVKFAASSMLPVPL